MADGSNFTPYYVAETSFGVAPASPVYTPLPYSGFTLAQSREQIESSNIKAGRFASKPGLGGIQAGGDINCDLTYGDYDDFIEAAMGGTWTADVLKAGNLRRSFTIPGYHSDLEGVNKYRVFRGMNINTMNIAVTTDAIVTAAFGCIGKNENPEDLSAETFNQATSTGTFDSFSGSIKEGGSTIGIVTEINFTLDNGMERKPTIMTGTEATQPSQGISKLTGNLTVYFNSMALREKYLNSTESSIEFTISNANGSYTFLMPAVTYTGGNPDVSGPGAITLPLTFEANLDEVEGSHLVITRS